MSKYPNYECGECSIWLGGCDLPNDELIKLCRARGCSLLSEDTQDSSGESKEVTDNG